MTKFEGSLLKAEIYNTYKSIGVNEDSARLGAESMVETSLRGVDSHGINLFPHYFRSFQSGRLNKNPNFQFHQTKGSAALLDADHALGHHSGIVAMDKCIEMAAENGIGACTVTNSSHYGASSFFGLHAAKKEYIGMAFTNADALVKSHNGKHSFFGTNPICFCAPLKGEEPLCLDMATSLVSWNKIKNYRRADDLLEPHWAFDNNGNPVTNPHEAASLSPAGDYKGFGLGMMVEVLCAMLSGSVMAKDMQAMFTSPPEAQRQVSHFFVALDISSFNNKDLFINNLTDMVHRLRKEPSIAQESVMAPGDPEKITFAQRINDGIPCFDEIIKEYIDINPEFKKCLKSKH